MGLVKAVFTLRRANFRFWFKNAMGCGLCSLLKAVRLPIIVSFCVILVSCGELSLIGNHTTSSFFIKIKFWKIATGKSRYLKVILIYSFLLQVRQPLRGLPIQKKRRIPLIALGRDLTREYYSVITVFLKTLFIFDRRSVFSGIVW